MSWGIGAFILLWLLSFVGLINGVIAISLITSGIIIILISFIMPKVTEKGAELRERIKGLKLYMSVAEKIE